MTDGKFYLGKELPELKNRFLYKSDDLTTHAVVFGMTGSGKTGLCIDLLEEAIEEEIPITIIDPKGDVSDISLMFPDLSAEEFTPWVSGEEAKKENLSLQEYGMKVANMWKKGLDRWGISGKRIRKIKDKTELRIFTPGSSAGLQIGILEGFTKPEGSFEENEEINIMKIKNSVSALLSLLDIEKDPLKSRPHILISSIIEHYWRNNISISIEDLILNIQKPPIKRLGVFEINRVINEKERADLAFEINNIIASPSFRFWKNGYPMSFEKLYKKENGKIPVNIFYTAHLPENEKMFFSSLLLNELVYWIKKQPGTNDLKYIFYMDEIYGYLPPYPKNPPSKDPMMILMKQARAFGLGMVLVTQNPKDIDYKALTNTGTWFIGKLQAQGDRKRVMEGLKGAMDSSGREADSSEIRNRIATLEKREFLIKNIHRKGIKTFRTRWSMSYLRGPLTPANISDMKKETGYPDYLNTPSQQKKKIGRIPSPPTPEIHLKTLFDNSVDPRGRYYSPYLIMETELVFDDNRYNLLLKKRYFVTFPVKETIDPDNVIISDKSPKYSTTAANGSLGFNKIPVKLNFSNIRRFQSSVKNILYSSLTVKFFINRELDILSDEEEDKDFFRTRCRRVAEKLIDREIEKIKDSYEKKIKRIEDRISREKQKIETLEDQHKSKKTEEIISIGETLLGFLLGSKSRRGFSTAARKRRMTSLAKDRIESERVKLSQFQEELNSLKTELEDKVADIEDKFYETADNIEIFRVRLEKEDIVIVDQSVLWKPV